MSYQYKVESLPLEWSTASTSTPSYYEQYDPTWTTSLDMMQDPCADLDYWREVCNEAEPSETVSDSCVQVSWDQFEADMQSPLSFTSNNQSPTTDSNSMSDYNTTFAGTSKFQTYVVKLSRNSTTGSEDGSTGEVDDESRIKVSIIDKRPTQPSKD